MSAFIILFFTIIISGCGKSGAGDATVFRVASPDAGYRCFVISDGGRAIGGNCAKECSHEKP